jgi:DNA-binding transcriptional MerR regulator
MSDATNTTKSLRERLPLHGGPGGGTEERLGRALSDLLENPLLTGALSRAFDVREKAAQAQEVAMGALNIPSAADIERLTRRLRSVSLRLEGIEEGVERLDRALSGAGERAEVAQHLAAIEERLARLDERLARLDERLQRAPAGGAPAEQPVAKAPRRRTAKPATRPAGAS